MPVTPGTGPLGDSDSPSLSGVAQGGLRQKHVTLSIRYMFNIFASVMLSPPITARSALYSVRATLRARIAPMGNLPPGPERWRTAVISRFFGVCSVLTNSATLTE